MCFSSSSSSKFRGKDCGSRALKRVKQELPLSQSSGEDDEILVIVEITDTTLQRALRFLWRI